MNKVNIYTFARFHSFDLARELNKKELLNKISSTYPFFIAKKWGIPKKRFRSRFLFELLIRLNRKIGFFKDNDFSNFLKFINCKLNIAYSKKTKIHISWSGSSFHLFKKLKRDLTNTLILERGSTHQLYQNKILTEEYDNFNIKYEPNYLATRNELIEYEISDYIVVPSNFVKNTFIEKGVPEKKIFVNPYGVDLTYFKPLEIKKEKFRIIFAGKACVRKGFQYLIEVMKTLKEYDIELWHLGSIHPEIKSFDYNQKNIKYLGSKPQNELYKYYNQCDAFVLPSLEEGLAMVTLQAMACGLPVICTPNTGIENVLTKDGEEGFIIPIRDPNTIVERVLELYNDKELLKKMGNKALEKLQNGFTWDDYGKRYIDFLNKISNE